MEPRCAAQQLADRYAATGNVAAVVLAGSLGRGRADAFSDVELDVYWAQSPSDDQRQAPALALKGEITALWPYDAEDAEWSEDVRVLGVDVTVSGFAVDEIDRWILTLPTANKPHFVRQMRLSAIHEGEPLHGESVVAQWRNAAAYPGGLAVATAASFLTPSRLTRWRRWTALVQRDDAVMLHRACSEAAEVLMGTLCALNQLYIEHPSFKWARHTAEGFTRAPKDFSARFFAAVADGPVKGAPELHALLVETVEIVAADLPEVDTASVDKMLNSRS